MQAQRDGVIGDIHVAATSKDNIDTLRVKLAELNARMGTSVEIHGWPKSDVSDPTAYQKALAALPRPAAAIIVVPDHLHHEITTEVIQAGVHPLVVKPFTPTLGEAADLIHLAEEQDLYGAVEFHKRFDESNLLLRQAIRDGRLGDLRYITVEYSQRRMMRDVFGSWLSLTNIFQYLGVHYVDLVYFLTGATPIRALALSQPSGGQVNDADSIQVVIEWQDVTSSERFVSTIATNWIDPNKTSAMSDQKITVVGTNGRYQVDQKNRGAQLVTETGGIEEVNPYFSQIYTAGDGEISVNGYGPRCIIQFLKDVNSVLDGRIKKEDLVSQRPTFRDCLPSCAVVEAANQSLALRGEWVSVAEYSPHSVAAKVS
jgi:predicted dehydrogenase